MKNLKHVESAGRKLHTHCVHGYSNQWYFQFFCNLENMIRWQIVNGVSLRASSNLVKLALLMWVSNFSFG
jgi:hypothetical protein